MSGGNMPTLISVRDGIKLRAFDVLTVGKLRHGPSLKKIAKSGCKNKRATRANNLRHIDMMTTKIKITSDKKILQRIWSDEFADDHAGQTYEAEEICETTETFKPEGWAIVDKTNSRDGHGAKFPPNAYTILTSEK